MNDFIPLFECEAILRKHRIDVTPVRIDVLRVIYILSPESFTIQQVFDTLADQGWPRKRNTVEYTLRLYKARNILIHAASEPLMRRGRAEVKMLFPLFNMVNKQKLDINR